MKQTRIGSVSPILLESSQRRGINVGLLKSFRRRMLGVCDFGGDGNSDGDDAFFKYIS